MVRAVTYILLTFFLLCGCNSNVKKLQPRSCNPTVKDIERYQLQGNVKHIDIVEELNVSTAYFNQMGMLDSIIRYTLQDTLRFIYVYNSKGLLSELQVKHTDGKYEALYEYVYQGEIVSSFAFRGVDMQVLDRWNYEIESGKQVRSSYYNEGVLINRSEYSYNGLDKTEKVYSPENELLGETIYKYASPGRISFINSNGFVIEIEYGEDNLPSRSTNAVIGHDGEIFTNADSHLYGAIHYEYIKDAHGNWIERIELLGDEKVKGKTIRRNIIYR